MVRTVRNAYLVFVYLFLYAPVLVLVATSVNRNRYGVKWSGFSLDWYAKLTENRMLLEAAWHSVLVAFSAATLALALGTLCAFALYRYRFRGRNVFFGLIYVVTVSPDIVMGISLLVLFAVVALPLGFLTLLIGHVTLCMPFVAVVVLSRLTGFSPNIMEAARDLGASERQAFFRVILPMLTPALAAGWLLSFTLSLDDVVISFFVTGPTFEILPLRIYSMVRLGVKPEVNALCTLMFAVSILIVIIAQFLLKEERT